MPPTPSSRSSLRPGQGRWDRSSRPQFPHLLETVFLLGQGWQAGTGGVNQSSESGLFPSALASLGTGKGCSQFSSPWSRSLPEPSWQGMGVKGGHVVPTSNLTLIPRSPQAHGRRLLRFHIFPLPNYSPQSPSPNKQKCFCVCACVHTCGCVTRPWAVGFLLT